MKKKGKMGGDWGARVVYMFAMFASGSRIVKLFYFARLLYHLKKASRLDNFR